ATVSGQVTLLGPPSARTGELSFVFESADRTQRKVSGSFAPLGNTLPPEPSSTTDTTSSGDSAPVDLSGCGAPGEQDDGSGCCRAWTRPDWLDTVTARLGALDRDPLRGQSGRWHEADPQRGLFLARRGRAAVHRGRRDGRTRVGRGRVQDGGRFRQRVLPAHE